MKRKEHQRKLKQNLAQSQWKAYWDFPMKQGQKKIVKWTFPIWMYVAITGVMVYIFMIPYY